MFAAVGLMKSAEPSPDLINLVFFGHMLCYFPTLALTNTLAMRNMTNSEKEFPLIRVFGTIGWIAANQVISNGFQADFTATQYTVAGSAGLLLGVYSFFLPHTPPPEWIASCQL